jgi:hypothetical protein
MAYGSFPYGALPYGAGLAIPAPAPASRKILFLSPRLSDMATITASSEVPSLPARNLQNMQPTKVYRSLTTSTALTIVMPEPLAANCVALVGGNPSDQRYVRLLGASTLPGLGSAPVIDTDWVSPWATGERPDAPEWPHWLQIIRWENDETLGYWRLQVQDEGAPYVDIGRLVLGRAWQPLYNVDLDPSIGFVPLDVQEPNGYGQTFTDPRPYAQRQFDFNFSGANQDDVFDYAMELSRLRGQARDFIVCLDPAATSRFHQWSMQALFTGRTSYKAQPLWDGTNQVWGFSASMLECL